VWNTSRQSPRRSGFPREDLGEQGLDAGAIERLAERIEISNAQQPSLAHQQREVHERGASEREARGREERGLANGLDRGDGLDIG